MLVYYDQRPEEIHLRDRHRRCRVEEGYRTLELRITCLLVVNVMFHISCLRLDSILRKIRYASNQRMRRRAVVALVVVLHQTLPVCIDIHVPVMVKRVVLRKVEILHAWLLVDLVELVVPVHIRLLAGLKVDPYEAGFISVYVYRKQGMLGFVEIRNCFESRGLC